MLFPQTLEDIALIQNDTSGSKMSFSKWRDFCWDARKKRYDYIQIDKDKDLDDMYSIKTYQVWRLQLFQKQLVFKKVKYKLLL